MSLVCPPEARDVVTRERDAFQALYPQAQVDIRIGSSREAVAALFAAECDLAVITRELEPEERAAASRGGLELDGYRFARDALVAVVHPTNDVENLSVQDLASIYSGTATSWAGFAGPRTPIVPVVQPIESDVTGFFVQQVLAGEPIRARAVTAGGDSEVVRQVSREPGAVGYVTLAWADRGARALRMSSMTGLPYWRPDPETVYRGDYPLTRSFSCYVRTTGKKLPNGFITFVTSRDGQKLVHDAGLVPTSVPVRFVRRSPMMSTHPTGDGH